MGLDMYLKRGKKIPKKSNRQLVDLANKYSWLKESDLDRVPTNIKDYLQKGVSEYSGVHYDLTTEVGYWRKANEIHEWFVQHIQNGVDECNTYIVPKVALQALLSDCKKVLASSELKVVGQRTVKDFDNEKNDFVEKTVDVLELADTSVAKELLPTHEGFFFGSYEYNEWYVQDLKDTIEILEKVLAETDFTKEFITYHSSW